MSQRQVFRIFERVIFSGFCIGRMFFLVIKDSCRKGIQRRCEQARSYFIVNLMFDAFRKSGFYVMCFIFYVWFLFWKLLFFFQYLILDYFWQDIDSLLVVSECLNVFIFLKRLKKNFFSKVLFFFFKVYFNLIVWYLYSRNETLCGKIKIVAILKWFRVRKYKFFY